LESRGAALDVWWQCPTQAEPERRPSRRPFHELPNVLMTPHCSSSSDATAERRGRQSRPLRARRGAWESRVADVTGVAVADELETW